MADPPNAQPPARHWLYPTRRRVVVGLIVALALWGWFDVRNRAVYDPQDTGLHKTDFTVYTEAGAAFFDGRDPYQVTNLRGWGYLYPPLFAMLVAPLSLLDTRDQALVWFALSVLMAWGCLYELTRIARAVMPEAPQRGDFGPIPNWLATAALVATALPALNCLQRGQVGVLKLYALLLGFRLLVAGGSLVGPALAGAVLAFPVVLKITPIVPVGMALAQQLVAAASAATREAWSRAAAAWLGNGAGLALGVLLVPAVLVGWRANLEHLETWWNHVAVHAESANQSDFAGDSTSPRNQSLSNATHRLGNWVHHAFFGGPDDMGPEQLRQGGEGLMMDAPPVDAALAAARALAGCLLIAVSVRMARRQDTLGQAAAFGLACVATLIVFSIARGHYFVMLLPAVTFTPCWLLRAGHQRLAVAMAVAPGVLVVVHYLNVGLFGRLGVLGLGITLWYFAACGVLLWIPGRAAAAEQPADDRVATPMSPAEQPIAA